MLTSSIGRLRLIGITEGLSFLVLVFVAMPLKYHWGDPSWVRVVGGIHGALFVVFCFALFDTQHREKWSLRQTLVPFVASLIPFGPFLIDHRLKTGQI